MFEIERTLVSPDPKRGLTLLIESGLLSRILPELCRLANVPQNPSYHLFDVLEHTLQTVSQIAPDLTLRWAALLHDIAKGSPGVRGINKQGQPSDIGHDEKGAELANSILERLNIPLERRTRIVWLVAQHSKLPDADKVLILRWLRRLAKDFTTVEELREACCQLMELNRADLLAGHVDSKAVMTMMRERLAGELLTTIPFYPAQLQISDQRIREVLGEEVILVKVKQDLLTRIQQGELDNTSASLEDAVMAKAKRNAKKNKATGFSEQHAKIGN